MTDIETEEILEGPKVSEALEFGGTEEKPRLRDRFWYRSMISDSKRDEGLVIKVAKRPRTRRGEDPHATLRLLSPNVNGILFQKVKSGDVRLENYFDFNNRMVLQARDEEAKREAKGK